MSRLKPLQSILLLFVLGLTLQACGGGGGGSDGGGGGNADPQNQTITFADPGPVNTTVASSMGVPLIDNPASGGGGTGAITYESSDTAVALVDEYGVATRGIAGSATITATKAASAGYNSATASYVINVARITPTLSLNESGPFELLPGASFANPADTSEGSYEDIRYTSSDTNVVTVDSVTGNMTAVGAGSATITASREQDDYLNAAEASFEVTVVTSATATAWVDEDQSEVSFSVAAGFSDYLRSTERNCDVVNDLENCNFGRSDSLFSLGETTNVITDSSMNLPLPDLSNLRSGYHYLKSGDNLSNRVLAGSSRFSPRVGHGAVYFDERYWVIAGGYDAATNAEVWASDDGSTWELVNEDAPFGAHWFGHVYAFAGKLWVLQAGPNNLWSSTDGVIWTDELPTGLPFIDPTFSALAVDGTRVWLVHRGNTYATDESSGGRTWTQQNAVANSAGGDDRQFATLTAFQESGTTSTYLYLIGGDVGGTTEASVWRSSDGDTWTDVSGGVPFGARAQHSSFAFDDKLWIFGGLSTVGGGESTALADTWSTSDGITWTEEASNQLLHRSFLSQVVVAEGKVKIIGGVKTGYYNQVFESEDGVSWNELSPYAQFTPRFAANATVFNDAIWLTGGRDHLSNATNDTWSSTDGNIWEEVAPQADNFAPTSSHGMVEFNNRLWVIGGWDGSLENGGTATPSNEVWSTTDGDNWTQHTPSGAIFSPATPTR